MAKKILIIDDDPEIVSYLTDIFSEAGFETRGAGNGVTGLDAVKSFRPDLITLDMDMPERGGTLFYAKLRQEDEFKDTPLIVISGVGPRPPALKKDILTISKPINPDKVVRTVKDILGE